MGITSKDEVSIVKRLIYRGKNKPSERNSKAKIKLAVNFLLSIANDPSKVSITVVKSILETIEVYMRNFKFKTLDKILLKILNKAFDASLLSYITNLDDVEILAAYTYVKFKHQGILDTRIFSIYDDLKGDIKKKIDLMLESSSETNILRRNRVEEFNFLSTAINDQVSNITNCLFYTNKACIDCNNYCFFCQYITVTKVWNDFSLIKSNPRFQCLSSALSLLEENKLKLAKESLLVVIKSNDSKVVHMSYNLMALIHFLSLEYFESILYLDQMMNTSSYYDLQFALNCKFFVENFARIPSIQSCISIKYDLSSKKCCDEAFIKENFENKYLMDLLFQDSINRIVLFNDEYPMNFSVEKLIKQLQIQMEEYSPLFLFERGGMLNCFDLENHTHLKLPNWEDFNVRFLQIMYENQKILKFKANTPEDKSYWWIKRYKLDSDLRHLFSQLKVFFDDVKKEKILLILEGSISHFPFEAVFDKPALRILSNNILAHFESIEVNEGYYLLDPASNLPSTRQTIKEFLDSIPRDIFNVRGVIGRSLDPGELEQLAQKDMFLFFGHGSGKRYFQIQSKNPKSLLLFGCSSCKLLTCPNFKANGFSLRYLNNNRTVLGNLWDVTDKDLDKLTISLLSDLLQGHDIVDAIYRSKGVCKLKHLNSSALVIYGSLTSFKIKPA